MEWEVNYTDKFEEWWNGLTQSEQEAIDAKIILLQRVGPTLGRPNADTVRQSRHANMKELVIQCGGDPYRVFYAFDPRREAILLIGGIKTDDKRFYEKFIPIADDLYDAHLGLLEGREEEQ